MRPGYYDDIRVSDAERAEVTDLLARHYSDGRLDKQEFDERAARAMSAKTRGDLAGLFDDLPDTEPPAGESGKGPGVSAPARSYRMSHRRGGPAHPILALVAIFIVASIAWHAFAQLFFFPGIAVVLLIAVVLFANRASHRHRPDR
jgi:hypothetical protein